MITQTEIIWFYLFLFTVIIVFKKWRMRRVAINGIWFSTDGLIPEDVIQNFKELAHNLKQSPYRKHYQLFFWTDTKKLKKSVKHIFKKHKIKVNDYRDAFLTDDISKTARNWIDHLLTLADENNKLFFVLASDMFRAHLLLKTFPARYSSYSYVLYFDCNDISITYLPNPQSFKTLRVIAFHFVEFSYFAFEIFRQLVDCQPQTQWLLTNDVIISCQHKRNSLLFNTIFENYCHNLNEINSNQINLNHFNETVKDRMDVLTWTRKTMGDIDDDLVDVMIFTTTHMINILYAEKIDSIFLLNYREHRLKKLEIKDVQNVADYIGFVRNYDKGFTCYNRNNLVDTVLTKNSPICREFWYQLFIHRYRLRHLENTTIHF